MLFFSVVHLYVGYPTNGYRVCSDWPWPEAAGTLCLAGSTHLIAPGRCQTDLRAVSHQNPGGKRKIQGWELASVLVKPSSLYWIMSTNFMMSELIKIMRRCLQLYADGTFLQRSVPMPISKSMKRMKTDSYDWYVTLRRHLKWNWQCMATKMHLSWKCLNPDQVKKIKSYQQRLINSLTHRSSKEQCSYPGVSASCFDLSNQKKLSSKEAQSALENCTI